VAKQRRELISHPHPYSHQTNHPMSHTHSESLPGFPLARGLPGLAGVTTRPAGYPSGGAPPAVERQLHLLARLTRPALHPPLQVYQSNAVPPPAAAPPAVAPPAPPASPHSPLTGMAAMLADATSRGWLEELGGLGGLEPESTGAGVEQMLAAQLPPPEPTPVADISPEGLDPSPVSPAQTPQVSVRLATVVSGAASQKLVIPPAAGYPAGRVVTNASPGRPPRVGEAGHSSPPCRNRWEKLRIGTLGFGTGLQKRLLERWMNPKLARRACPCEHGLPSCRGN
jgi:hypothetical protein